VTDQTEYHGDPFGAPTDAESAALWALVEQAISDTADDCVCSCGCGEVDPMPMISRIQGVLQPEFDKLREQIQGLQVSDGYQSGWDHGVQARDAHYQRQVQANTFTAASVPGAADQVEHIAAAAPMLTTALRAAMQEIDDGALVLHVAANGGVVPVPSPAGLRGDWWTLLVEVGWLRSAGFPAARLVLTEAGAAMVAADREQDSL
jgi:hypothetical protein